MKFAKELERDAVPEWRIKYLNYKAGKKYVKAVTRAINRTPRAPPQESRAQSTGARHTGDASIRGGYSGNRPQPISQPAQTSEEEALNHEVNIRRYGSFVATPPKDSPILQKTHTNDFELPGPALNTRPDSGDLSRPTDAVSRNASRYEPRRSFSAAALPDGGSRMDGADLMQPMTKRTSYGTWKAEGTPRMRRLFSHVGGYPSRDLTKNTFGMEPFDLVRVRQSEFHQFMESELDKVENFYKLKEEQSGQRLTILREQLHEMRNRRIQELADSRRHELDHRQRRQTVDADGNREPGVWNPLKAKILGPGPNSKAFQAMPRTPHMNGSNGNDARRDYIRRPEDHDVSYRTAKRKLKLAMQEFYRGLELLKSYSLLNRTAFRKLNKKYDKAVNARPTYRFMNEKVNKAWFVTSDVLDAHIKDVEDLYARYFERGNHKLAAGKLRQLSKKHGDDAGSSFRNGLLIGIGSVFSVQGLIYGAQLLFHDDLEIRTRTSYLMQIYGGYFLMLFLFFWFCVNCWIWTRNKVNYPFIFEFDPRNNLDWRQLASFPSFFLLLFGIFIWTNFSRYGPEALYLYYPVILIGVSLLIIFMPLPIFMHKSRIWLAYSHWRLFLAGLYPVEFRDFFLGDMYCSLTYTMANIELFFCLNAKEWQNPVQCNSSHSRLLGFFTALPPIWRFLQCIRRYKDTGNVFPHLVNCGKYSMSITAAVMLSLFRIHGSTTNLALFITFATVNGIYCSIWDIFMDFSLMQADSRHRGLRDILALKQRWTYYLIMCIDPVLRFSWIFYAIFTHNTQHSTVVSFIVAFMEVARRGLWALLRVENEHCANVSQYKASRDVPLPYRIEPLMDHASSGSSPVIQASEEQQQQQAGGDAEQTTGASTALGPTNSPSSVRRRQESSGVGKSFSKMLAEAHKQDFEKKRKPPGEQIEESGPAGHSDDDDDDDDEEDEDEQDNMVDVQEAAYLVRSHRG